MQYLRWLHQQEDIKAFALGSLTVIILFAIIRAIFRILRFVFRLVFGIKKKQARVERQDKDLTDEELAYKEHGILPPGLGVYIYNYETGMQVNYRKDRYLSSREIGNEPLWQIRAIGAEQADYKFKKQLEEYHNTSHE